MKNTKRLFLIIADAIVLCILAYLFVTKDQIIINSGIKTTRILLIVFATLSVIISLCIIVDSILAIKKQNDELAKLKAQESENEEIEQRAVLSMKGKLEDKTIYQLLIDVYREKWSSINSELSTNIIAIADQLNDMNTYQSKLEMLLIDNDANALTDASDTLEQVEQYILQQVRTIINYMNIYNKDNENDIQQLIEHTKKVRTINVLQLNNVKEFLVAITDFINSQGNDDTGIKKLNIYKTTIQKSLEGVKNEII